MTKKKKRDTLSDRAIFELAQVVESGKKLARKYEQDWRTAQTRIADELLRRKVKSLTDANGTRVTVTQSETVVYDEDGLWAVLKPAQRRLVYDRRVNLSALPRATQEALLNHLTPAQRRAVVSHSLNTGKLEEAVQDGKISLNTVSPHSEIKTGAPYVTVSHTNKEG